MTWPGSTSSKSPRYCWHLSCILPRVPAISLRTGHLPARDRVRRRPVRSALGLARIQPVAARGVATALPAVQDHVHEWNREDSSQLPDLEELVSRQRFAPWLSQTSKTGAAGLRWSTTSPRSASPQRKVGGRISCHPSFSGWASAPRSSRSCRRRSCCSPRRLGAAGWAC